VGLYDGAVGHCDVVTAVPHTYCASLDFVMGHCHTSAGSRVYQPGKGAKNYRGHMASVEPETPKASQGFGMGRGYHPAQPTSGSGGAW